MANAPPGAVSVKVSCVGLKLSYVLFFIVFIIHIVNAYFVSCVQSVFECFNEKYFVLFLSVWWLWLY